MACEAKKRIVELLELWVPTRAVIEHLWMNFRRQRQFQNECYN